MDSRGEGTDVKSSPGRNQFPHAQEKEESLRREIDYVREVSHFPDAVPALSFSNSFRAGASGRETALNPLGTVNSGINMAVPVIGEDSRANWLASGTHGHVDLPSSFKEFL